MKKIIVIEGMSCNHCVNRIKKSLEELDGINVVEVVKGKATIEGTASNEKIKESIEDLGFDVITIE